MIKFNIEQFLKTGTFIPYFENKDIKKFLEQNSNDVFGEDFIIHYFYFKGYSVEFICDELGILKAQQIEITNKDDIKDDFLIEILGYDKFLNKFH